MNYPQRQQNPNGYQIAGQALGQVGQAVDAFSERQRQYQDMVQRRVMAMQEAARLADEEKRRAEEFEQKKHAALIQQQEADRSQKAMADFRKFQQGEEKTKPAPAPKPYLAPGMGPEGEAMYQPPAETEVIKPTREQTQSKALELGVYGDPGVKAYMDDTNPAKTLEGQKELFGIKASAQEKASAERMKYMQAMEEYRQGRTDARTVMTLKAAMDRAEMSDKSKPKTESGMPLKALGDTELKTLKDIKNTAYSINKIRILANNISSLKKGPIAGTLFGKNPYDTDLQALDRLVNQTVPALARGVFGEVGVLTDDDVNRYKKMLAGVKDSPELATQIMDDLEQKIASAYKTSVETYSQGGRDVSQFDPNLDFHGLVGGAGRPAQPGRDPALSAAIDHSANTAGDAAWTPAKERRYQELKAKQAAGR